MELKQCWGVVSKTPLPLLIVPYGIETDTLVNFLSAIRTFNRTLWN